MLAFSYLAKLEPLSSIKMYLDCFHRALKANIEPLYVLVKTANRLIPADKKDEFSQIIAKELEEDIKQLGTRTRENMKEYDKLDTALRTLNDAMQNSRISKGDSEALDDYIDKKNILKYESQRKDFENKLNGLWKYNTIVLRLAANHKEAAVRISVLSAIRDFPAKTNMELLQKLLGDNDEKVRDAAKQVADELEKIKNTPVDKLVSEPKGS